MSFKAKLSELIKHADRVYIDGLVFSFVVEGTFEGQFNARLDVSDGDPEFPEHLYVELDQEVELNEHGVGTIQVQDQEADEPEDDEPYPTKDMTIECFKHRPLIEADLKGVQP